MTIMNNTPLKRLVRKIYKRVAWAASWFVRPITIMRWIGILPFRMASFLEFEPVYFREQAVLNGPKPRCIQGVELWNALPVSNFIISHLIEVKEGLATPKGYVFDMRGEGSLKKPPISIGSIISGDLQAKRIFSSLQLRNFGVRLLS